MTGKIPVTPLEAWITNKIKTAAGCPTRESLKRWQLARLNETLARARAASPFYQRHWAAVAPQALVQLEQLAGYPLTTPADVGEQGLQMVGVSQGEISRVVTLNTSGTTGSPKRLYFTAADQELTIDFFRYAMATFVQRGDRVLILLPGERPGSIGDLLGKGLGRSGIGAVAFGFVTELAAAVAAMCREQATCLVGVPVQVLAMARYWEQVRKGDWSPQYILLSTDYVPQALVRELERIWRCEVYEHYGMTEMGFGGGIECAGHRGYHLRENDLYFEIIDPVSDQPLPDGEYGELVFTTLTRQGMPLIRYRTGDISRFIPGQCLCGSRLRRLERIRSRAAGRVTLGTDMWLTLAELDEVLFTVPGIVNFHAAMSYGDAAARLVITAAVVGIAPETALLTAALRNLASIRTAAAAGQLEILIKMEKYGDGYATTPGKRVIHVAGRAVAGRGSDGRL
ncbi:DVU_1553 family AMP-dependent CoA ligase [Sporomusa termitida]|uniref:Phenylacetate-CoA ligase n=1 Tax=Sporomusa termitida TaxID=2377 RepID=A0A517DQQ5_9FIRM|nr:AMP-binding protein [Sporomusa termitida]QDR79685.1 phenylacetate-CoA ligase [Sporomusa termitida]